MDQNCITVKVEEPPSNDNDIHTVYLQNIPTDNEIQPVILNNYISTANSDGNFNIENAEEEEVIHTYILENGEYTSLSTEVIEEDITNQAEYDEVDENSWFNINETNSTEDTESQVTEESVDDPEPIYVDNVKEEEGVICQRCNKLFGTLKDYEIHAKAHKRRDERGEDAGEDEGYDPLAFEICPCCGDPVDSAHMLGDFKCDECDLLFEKQSILQRHKSLEHPEDRKWYKCSECKVQCREKNDFINHMKIHSVKHIKCPDCGKEFRRKYHFERHIQMTGCTGVKRVELKCNVCSKIFFRRDNLKEHLEAHAGNIKKKRKEFPCDYCHKVFQTYALLNVHVRTHTGERPYPCDLCPKRFPSSGAMKKHRRMHTGEKPFKCTHCGNRFAAKETLNRHVKTHTGDKPHACQFCGKSFIQAAQLRAHVFHHTGENAYTCKYCNRAFNRKLRLTTHIKFMHEGAEPLHCGMCQKTFFRKEDLSRHMISHTGVKAFDCDQCGKSFAVKSSLKIHKLTHKQEPPCSCEYCGRAFIRQDCLMRHMRAKHRDILEHIMINAEKRRLQQQLLNAATASANLSENIVWNELTLTESVKELLTLLVDEDCLKEFGHPDAPVDKVLDAVIKRCGHPPASEEDFDYIGRMRENAKLLFTVVIDDEAVKALLNNQTVDEVIMHVLRLAKNQV